MSVNQKIRQGKRAFLAVCFIFLSWASLSNAAVVKDLYTVRLPAQDQTVQQRASLLNQAFREVLVRVSGQEAVLAVPALAPALGNPENYVSQFSYVSSQDPKLAPNSLVVAFQKSALDQLLIGAGQPVWGSNRPVCLVWIVVKQADGQLAISGEASQALREALSQEAGVRGLPLIFPLLDLKDLAAIQAQNLWFGDWPTIFAASQRYSPSAILILQWDASQANISAHFVLSLDQAQSEWTETGTDLPTVANAGFDSAVDTLASAYAIRQGDTTPSVLTIRVEGVTGLAELTRTLRFFQNLTGTEQVVELAAGPSELVLQVHIQGNVEAYLQQIPLGKVLTPLTATTPGELRYQYGEKT